MQNSRTVYAAHLPLAGDPAKNRTVARALARRWLTGPDWSWPSDADPSNCRFTTPDGRLVACRRVASTGETLEQFWEMIVISPHDDPTMRWRASILVGGKDDAAWMQVRYGLEPAPGCDRIDNFVAFDAAEPAIVHSVVDTLDVRDAGWQHSTAPFIADTPAAIEQVAEFIAHPSRRLPVVLSTRAPGSPIDENVLECAQMTAGIAHSVDIPDRDGAVHLERLLGGGFIQRLGTWRIFFAGWAPTDPPSKHPEWRAENQHPNRYASFGKQMSRRMFAVSAFRVPIPRSVHRAIAANAAVRLSSLRAEKRSNQVELTDEMLNEWEADLARADQAEQELEATRSEIAELRRSIAAISHTTPAPAPPPPPEAEPATVLEAVQRAQKDHECLTFLPRAFESAEACPFRRPQQVYDDLTALAGIVETWQVDGRLPSGWAQAAADAGLVWANDISTTAKTKYRDDYEVTLPDGTSAVLAPHFKRSAATGPAGHYRCYLHIDDNARKVYVGYVGPHLRDASNP